MQNIQTYTLENNLIKVIFLDYSATTYQIYLKKDGIWHPILSTPQTLEDFINNPLKYGKTMGRTAGRLHKTSITEKYVNFNDNSSIMHGGINGFHDQFFKLKSISNNKIIFNFTTNESIDNYKGILDVIITYEITNTPSLLITQEATGSEDTLCNLTSHPYFNLEQEPNLNNHNLFVDSKYILSKNELGMFEKPILASTFNKDYLEPRNLEISENHQLDDIYLLDKETEFFKLSTKNFELSLKTNYPALVLFTQNAPTKTALSNATIGTKHSGIAVECQLKQSELPLLKHNEKYNYYVSYDFKIKN